jgi:exonuclease I
VYIFFDTETGGLTPEHSLLTLSAIVTDPQLNVVVIHELQPGLYLRLKHDNYVTQPRAMQVNQIDLAEHDQFGFTLPDAIETLIAFIREAKAALGVQRFIPAGHNVPFDMRFLQAQLLPPKMWDNFFMNPPFDTCAAARLFNAANRLNVGCGLGKLCTFFGIDAGTAHNAESDNLAAIELARKFVSWAQPATIAAV